MTITTKVTIAAIVISVGLIAYMAVTQRSDQQTVSRNLETGEDTNQLPATPKGSSMDVAELKIEDTRIGTGSPVKSGDTVVMHYKGTLLDGTKFDSSYDRGTPFTTQIGVGRVIQGWDQGVPGMKVGGVRKLTIPSSLGYGAQGVPGAIPPSAALVFDVELVEIK